MVGWYNEIINSYDIDKKKKKHFAFVEKHSVSFEFT